MNRNTALLESVMQHISDHPETHNQSEWFCGTAACFAGWAAWMTGWQQLEADSMRVRRGGCSWEYADVVARDELGLTVDEGQRLFDANNTRDMLQLMVKDLVNGDELRPWSDYRDETSEL